MQIYPSKDIALRDVVSFSLYDNTTIGTVFTRVKLLGVVDYATAAQTIDPVALHEDIITNLPEGSVDDPTQYSYLKLELENGAVTYVGMPWVDESTLTKVGESKLQVTLSNMNVDDVPNIIAALNANGFNVESTKVL